MTNKNKIILFGAIFLFISSYGYTQSTLDLEALGLDPKILEQIQQEENFLKQGEYPDQDQDEPNIETETETSDSDQSDDLEEEAYIDEDFGYQGREDFLVEPQKRIAKKTLKKFGYDYFNNRPTTFAPLNDIPIPPDYLIGPGDEVKLILYGNTNKSYSLFVTRDGDIYIPEIGPISIAGLSFSDLKETITKIVDIQLIGTQVTLTLGELRSINIFVLGEAAEPGMYTVSSLATMTNAIFNSGGVSQAGSLRNIELRRNGSVISKFDLYDLLLKGNTNNDARLMSGDVIFIPSLTKSVAISGEVQREGIYELLENETGQDLINYAGKTKSKSDLSLVEIQRINKEKNGFDLFFVDLRESSASNLQLQNGDTISVYPVNNRISNSILLKGHYPQPGFYPWRKGMRVIELFRSLNDLLPMTDLNYLLVQRKNLNKLSQPFSFYHINIQELFENPDSENNIYLNDQDEITFFPNLSYCNILAIESVVPLDSTKAEEQKKLNESPDAVDAIKAFEATDTLQVINTFQLDQAVKNAEEMCRKELIQPVIDQIEKTASDGNQENMVKVTGNVYFPGEYPLTKNATLEDAIYAAGNIKDLSYMDEVELIRNEIVAKKLNQTKIVDKFENIKDLIIQPLDWIIVKKISSDYREIEVAGEIYFPGIYPIQKSETLTDILSRAGGLTDFASLKNIVFTRAELAEQQRNALRKSSNDLLKQITLVEAQSSSSSNANQQTEYLEKINMLLSDENDSTLVLGRIVFDYEDIINGLAPDIELREGDKIFIPKKLQNITVIGEVYSPNTHIFDSDKSISDYISSSGGITNFGDDNSVYIIKGNGEVINPDLINLSNTFFRNNSSSLEGGDTIVVPLEIKTFEGVKLANEVTQIIYQMAVATAAVNSF